MSEPPKIFDRQSLSRQRNRANIAAADFLHQSAIDEIDERLKEVNRTFTNPAVVTGHPTLWSKFGKPVQDDDTLDLAANQHALVIHGLCLHWSNDPVAQLIQCRRALLPDGLFMCALFGGQTLSELRISLAEAESSLTGGLSPRVSPMAEIRDLGGLLQRAGFAMPVADLVATKVEYQSSLHLMKELRQMGETNAMGARPRSLTSRALLMDASQRYFDGFGTESGGIIATFDVIFLTGWAPSPDQPKALRPGSATNRLADALDTTEHNPDRLT